jgi:hypothetical protein
MMKKRRRTKKTTKTQKKTLAENTQKKLKKHRTHLRHINTCMFGLAFGKMHVDSFSDVAYLASHFSMGTIAVCALAPLLCGACANLAAPRH